MNNIDILSRDKIDNETEKFLMKYRPNALKEATKLDLEALTEKQKLVKLCAWLQTVRKSIRNNIIN